MNKKTDQAMTSYITWVCILIIDIQENILIVMITMLNQNHKYIPSEYYYLGNTPLNESLVYINTLLPMFKKKYDIGKMTFITLTDGAGNHVNTDIIDGPKKDWDKTTVFSD